MHADKPCLPDTLVPDTHVPDPWQPGLAPYSEFNTSSLRKKMSRTGLDRPASPLRLVTDPVLPVRLAFFDLMQNQSCSDTHIAVSPALLRAGNCIPCALMGRSGTRWQSRHREGMAEPAGCKEWREAILRLEWDSQYLDCSDWLSQCFVSWPLLASCR